jgi:hypothetical protein
MPSPQIPQNTPQGKVSSQRLKQLAISETGFVFDPQTGQSFTVNSTGQLVLGCLKENDKLEDAAKQLAQACDVPIELSLPSVEAFVMQLSRYL